MQEFSPLPQTERTEKPVTFGSPIRPIIVAINYNYLKQTHMKTIVYLFALLMLSFMGYSQNYDSLQSVADEAENILINNENALDSTSFSTQERINIEVNEKGDTLKLRIGEKNIQIYDEGEKTRVEIYDEEKNEIFEEEEDDFNDNKDDHSSCKKGKKFRGHWAGIEIGLNNLLDENWSMSRSAEESYMELNTNRSVNVNLNFMQYSIGLGSNRVGLVTGMGLEFNNYFFSNNNTIDKENGIIVPVDTLGTLDKSKLTTVYLKLPLLIEAQFFGGGRDKRLCFSAGVIGGMKLGAHTKYVYFKETGEEKSKNFDDFYLNSFRWGITSRIGYKGINIYAEYYPTPLFQKDRGPELYPFSAGISLTF
jgi:hypothetical protein